ncbi:hypothetical protein LDENG_00059500 [Lucifuga dentata]|nr:hypothetical protein LDENG_00059500 [Lucifuga dentata]
MNAARYREVLEENLFHMSGSQTGVTVHLSARQRPEASSQDNAGAASGQVPDCPQVQPKPRLKPHRTEHLRRDLKMEVHKCFHPI